MKAKSNYIPPEQMTQLIQAIPNLHIRRWKDEDVVMMFLCCYWLNLRISECLRLFAEHFDLDNQEVYLGQTKKEKEEYAAIPPDFIPELRSWLQDKHGPLFPKCSRFVVYTWLKRLGKMLDIPALTTSQKKTGEKTVCHIFRKSMGKDMLYGVHGGKKAPLNEVSAHLRHKGRNALASTSQYLKLGLEDNKEWWNSLAPPE